MPTTRLTLLFLTLVCLGATDANAQIAAPRLEVGVHAAFLRLSDFDTTSAGVGGRVSLDVTRWFALDGEGTFFPKDEIILPVSSVTPDVRVSYDRRRAEAFAGVKIGARGRRVGAFVKARPGFTRLSGGGARCSGADCALVLLIRPEYRTEFALDLGGVFELYPSARTVARFELSDVMIKHRSVAPPCWGSNCATSHNLATRIGVGWRF